MRLRKRGRIVYVSLKDDFKIWLALLAGACLGWAFRELSFISMLLAVSLVGVLVLLLAEMTGSSQE